MHTTSTLYAGLLLGLSALGLASACTDDGEGLFSLAATRADGLELSATATPFTQATRADEAAVAYRIYAIKDPTKAWVTDTTNNLTATNSVLGCPGTSPATGGKLTGDSIPTRFKNQGWYFYGITTGTADDPATVADSVYISGKAPVYHFQHIQSAAGRDTLPDVRVSYPTDTIGMEDTENGLVDLKFTHTTAKLVIYISQASADAQLFPDTLISFEICDHNGGRFDLLNNQWRFNTTTDTLRYISILGDTLVFNKTFQTVTDGCLFYPGSELKVKAQINNHFNVTDNIEATIKLDGSNVFQANHVYTIMIQYLMNGTFIITTHPYYYDYVAESTEELSVGTSTLFNGVVWSDRNIGATSATYGNLKEWEEMRGYYYQSGRNIPYKVYPVKTMSSYRVSTEGGSTYEWVQSNGDAGNDNDAIRGRYMYPYLPGLWDSMAVYKKYRSCYVDNNFRNGRYFWDKNGNSTTSVADYAMVSLTTNGVKYFLTLPDTVVSYKTSFMDRFAYFGSSDKSNPQWRGSFSKLWEQNITPCPPGWRIPTDDEWCGIMPVSQETGDITYQYTTEGTGTKQHTNVGTNCWYQYSTDDPTSGYNSSYYCYNSGGAGKNSCGEIYIIKKMGTKEAYGLRISADMSLVEKESINYPDGQWNAGTKSLKSRTVLLIDRYTFQGNPMDARMSKENPPYYGTDSSLYTLNASGAETKWYHVEQLKLPVCGVGHYRYLSFIWSGTEAHYATANSHQVRIKLGGSTDNRFIYVDKNTARTSCMSVRSVRDAYVAW